MGDFNFPNIVWSHISPFSEPSSTECNEFITLCSDFGFSQMVTSPTRITRHSTSLLDLVLTSSPDKVSSITHLPGLSDHDILHFTLTLPQQYQCKQLKTIRNFKRANFSAINSSLCSFLHDFLPQFFERSVERNWCMFKNKILELVHQHVPLQRVYSNNQAPWYNRFLNMLSNRKRRLFRTAKRTKKPAHWLAYKNAASNYSITAKNTKHTFFSKTLPLLLKTNPKRFWSVVKCKRANKIALTQSGSQVSSHLCADVLNSAFLQSFSSPAPNNECPVLQGCNFPAMDPIIFDATGIKKIIENLKITSSCGVDEITTKFLISTVEYSSIILQYLFSQSYLWHASARLENRKNHSHTQIR